MTMTVNPLNVEVAEPGSVFWETIQHPENVELLEGDERTRKLPADRLKTAEKKLLLLKDALNVFFTAYIEHLKTKRDKIDDKLPRLERSDPVRAEAAANAIAAIGNRINDIQRERLYPVKQQRNNPHSIRTKQEAREALSMVHRLQARIEEHYRALENERINIKLQDQMQGEINFFANQIIDRWTALGFREEWIVEGKRHLRRVQFEECHYTEDNLQFKVAVTSLTLLESTQHHLPDKVKAWDLVKPETLRELEAACECPVTSPHTDEEQGFEKGCWVIVHRVGMRDGLFNYLDLSVVLPKYNAALRPRLALPVGVKAGRKVEYCFLDTTPHIMVTGITGAGKTNLVRAWLTVLSQFYSPDEIRFYLIDLKRSGDLNQFRDVPHLIGEIVKDIGTMEKIMPQLVALMQQRMAMLSGTNSVDILEYNRKASPENQMPQIIVVVDECGSIRDLADDKNQSDTILRCLTLLAAQARAAGIHLIIGTQQPNKDAIPSRITNNITYSVAAWQRTTSGSMATTGNNRLKKLGGIRGRMLVDTGLNTLPVQTPYTSPADIDTAVKIAKDYPAPRPLHLPGDDEETNEEAIAAAIEAAEAAMPKPVTRDQIIAFALEHDGIPNAQKIYEQTGGVTPRERIKDMIKQLRDDGEVTYQDTVYAVESRGKITRIYDPAENRKTAKPPANVSHGGSDDGSETVLEAETEAAVL